jgi:hypothetical protein
MREIRQSWAGTFFQLRYMASRFGEHPVDCNSIPETESPLNFKRNKWPPSANPMNLNVALNVRARMYALGVVRELLFRLPLKCLLARTSQSTSSEPENNIFLVISPASAVW